MQNEKKRDKTSDAVIVTSQLPTNSQVTEVMCESEFLELHRQMFEIKTIGKAEHWYPFVLKE